MTKVDHWRLDGVPLVCIRSPFMITVSVVDDDRMLLDGMAA
ncbi:hypothetical protein FHR83_005881 [Actinoplanes campanulatus]|uniref:Uncharacterized protein n=1 Tax=Actinoplanes campanulatus TaxID=113559 RepID=A0A7W5FH45_9ACTN|nr:hypothetical protein [Actinoplanes campanulatus]MBB3098186.1 hypothetical protein [Actinoplanes campanulatus]